MSEALERAARLKTKSELLADKIKKLTEQQKAFENEITELELSDVKQSVNKNGIEIEDAPTAIEIYSVGKKYGLTREEMIESQCLKTAGKIMPILMRKKIILLISKRDRLV